MKSFLSGLFATLFFILNPTIAKAQYSSLELKIERYTAITGEIDVRSYLKNVEDYRGLRLVAIEVVASALLESATTMVLVSDKQQGDIIHLGLSHSTYPVLVETDSLMGEGAEEIKLQTRNPAYIKAVTLIFAR